jgi:TatD DNase family protein
MDENSKMRGLIDSHCHLQFSSPDAVTQALQNGVSSFICNSTSENDWDSVLNMKSSYITPCIGLHPWYLNTVSNRWEEKMREILTGCNEIHIGEIGLDNYKSKLVSKATQELYFRKQIRIAIEYRRTISVHCVSAFGKLFNVLSQEIPAGDLKVLLHSWEGPLDISLKLLKLFGQNIVFSLSMPSLTKPKHAKTILEIPETNIVIETDSPSQCVDTLLTQEIIEYDQGKPINKPIYLKYVLQELSSIKRIPIEDLKDILYINSIRIFNL